jgi:hypothetical protein
MPASKRNENPKIHDPSTSNILREKNHIVRNILTGKPSGHFITRFLSSTGPEEATTGTVPLASGSASTSGTGPTQPRTWTSLITQSMSIVGGGYGSNMPDNLNVLDFDNSYDSYHTPPPSPCAGGHSFCDRLNSDLGSEFHNGLFKELSAKIGFKHTFSSVAHPTSNGQVEPANRSILTYMRKFITENGRWESMLPALKFALNSAPHTTKRYSRFKSYMADVLT